MAATKTFPPGETAYMLRRLLGPLRSWDDALTDMRLSKTTLDDFTLLPVCRTHDGRSYRPGYAAADIATFVKEIRAANPEARPDVPYRFQTVDLDTSDGLPWQMRKLSAIPK